VTQSTDSPAAAIERDDADWLAANVDGTACPPALLAALARHADPRLRLLAVRWLGSRLAGGSGVHADLVGVLPGGVDEVPEVALAVAELFQRHGRHAPPASWPRRRDTASPAVVRVAWLRAEFLHLPGRLAAEPRTEATYQAVAGLRCADASDPPRLLDELTAPDDPVLHATALRLCREGLRAAVLAPAIARRVLIRLCDSADPAVVAEALTDLAQPWTAVDPTVPPGLRTLLTAAPLALTIPPGPRTLLAVAPLDPAVPPGPRTLLAVAPLDPAVPPGPRTLLAVAPLDPAAPPGPPTLAAVLDTDTGPAAAGPAVTPIASRHAAVAEAAVAAAARHGLRDPLLDAAADPRLPPAARQHALTALGDMLDRDGIPAVVDLAATDPLLLGRPAVACLSTMHHRGMIPAADSVAGIVGLALADHTIPADAVAMLLYTARHAVLDTLLAEVLTPAAVDPGWPRRLELLVALARQGVADLDIGGDIARLLLVAGEPEPFLAALRALRYAPAEDAVLAVLPRAPAAALHALEAVGGERTAAVLAEALVGDGAPYLRPWRHQALELCWLLQPDPDRRHALLRRLDPVALPDRIAADLGRPDERELAVLRARATPDRPLDALIWLAGTAGAGTVAAVTEVLGRVVAELALAYDTRGNPHAQWHRLPADLAAVDADRDRPAATKRMPVVPQEALDALHGLGRRLHRHGRIRPVCLLDAAEQPTAAEHAITVEHAAGDAFVASVALDLLDRPRATPTELAVLLELLQRAPYAGTRRRIHRLLRHRDPHVRKHAIALLARDGAEALAPTLTLLTAATDAQTVRQALAALGQVGARWAGHAVAACLDHPNMNIKKAAADALRTTGTPATVPDILGWLGRHDNPGLRTALTAALRAILGDATDATILAAAEHPEDARARELLLEALDGALSARSVAALTDQGSPAGPALLRLAAGGRLRLREGTVASLADRMAAHGITPPAGPAVAGPHPDLVALTRDGWQAATARRVATGHDPADLPAALLPDLRRLLPDWLRLAATEPALRPSVLRLVLRCAPVPWTPAERAAGARFRGTLVDGAGDLAHADRDALLAVLEDLAPHLSPGAALDVAFALRVVPPAPAGHRSTLTVLRRCGAVLTRRDVERALADAALGADPWRGEVRVLREAFALPEPTASQPAPAGGPASRERLAELVAAWPATAPGDRPALLDRMHDLQPIDALLWTIGEETDRPPSRTPHDGDLDQPRSAALRDRLLTMLEHPRPGTTQRERAARALLTWPEPAVQRRLLQVYLPRDADLPSNAALARALTPADLAPDTAGTPLLRAARLTRHLTPAELAPLIPALLRLRDHGDGSVRRAATTALRRLPRPTVEALLGEPLTPLLLPAPVEPRLPATLLERPAPPVAPGPPTHAELLQRARSGDAAQIRVALAALAETGTGATDLLEELLEELLRHAEPKVRLHAHRVSRQVLDRPAYLRHSEILLADPQPDIVRSAIRAVSGAAWTPAVGAVVGLLLHQDPTVRRTAEAGLARFGQAAVPALTKAAGRARPDRRGVYTTVLADLAAAADPPG
jgi:HEAT repeat protein